MKLIYKYDNGIVKRHTTYINKKNIYKECEASTRVSIYKAHTLYMTEKLEYITTLLLK